MTISVLDPKHDLAIRSYWRHRTPKVFDVVGNDCNQQTGSFPEDGKQLTSAIFWTCKFKAEHNETSKLLFVENGE